MRALRERSSVEVSEELRRKGTRVGLNSLVVSKPSLSSVSLLLSLSSEEEEEDDAEEFVCRYSYMEDVQGYVKVPRRLMISATVMA